MAKIKLIKADIDEVVEFDETIWVVANMWYQDGQAFILLGELVEDEIEEKVP